MTSTEPHERRVVVVGGGMIGMTAALHLAHGGATVTLLEADGLAGGATGGSFAWINANNKEPLEYHDLNLAGMDEHARLARQLDGSWLHTDGHVEWAVSDSGRRSLVRKLDRLAEWGYAVDQMTVTEFARLEPHVAVPADVEWVAHFPTEGWVDGPDLVRAVHDAACTAGAQSKIGERVVGFDSAAHDGIAVRSDRGTTYIADAVVICAGANTHHVAGLAGGTVPMANTPGLVVTIDRAAVEVRTIITSSRANIRPDGPDRYCLQAPALDGELDGASPEDRFAIAEEVHRRATEIVPGAAAGTIESVRASTRPIPADGLPAVGELAAAPGIFVAVSHSAITIGPLLGRLIANQVLTGRIDDRVRSFGPDRFRTTDPGQA